MAKKSYEVLNDPFLNKGTAFTKEERKELELTDHHKFKQLRNKQNKYMHNTKVKNL